MQLLKNIVAVLGVLGSGLIFGVGLVFALLAAATILSQPDTWYFPGDPPVADIGVEAAIVALVALAGAALIIQLCGLSKKLVFRRIVFASVLSVVAAAALPVAVMASRHLGEWKAFRALAWKKLPRPAPPERPSRNSSSARHSASHLDRRQCRSGR